MIKRRNLVIVRAGRDSLHQDWMRDVRERSWDLVVSWYAEHPSCQLRGDFELFIPGGKWNGIFRTISQMPRPVESYKYIWLPDDDIDTTGEEIEKLFAESEKYQLLIAQPSLTHDSFYSYQHTLHCGFTYVRYTDMVELMMPCFLVDHLQTVLPLFADTATGWGLDWIWCRLARENFRRYAILDRCVVRHTRPLGLHLYEHADAVGENAMARLRAFMARYPQVGLDFKPTCYSSVGLGGFSLGHSGTAAAMAMSHAFFLKKARNHSWEEAIKVAKTIYKTRRLPDFTTLTEA